MSEIECVNLLAFIQFTIAFDFGLYYLDDKHALTKIYRKYQMDLRVSILFSALTRMFPKPTFAP